ncbi:MAG TPA: hypothetical protein VMU41_02690 [Candidatus Binataceae bacterium]|nr:hypothetical protein [Candidatus Binataceae bacterium]
MPGFIDLQVNGAYGIDVMAASAADLVEFSHCLAHDGTTSWMPTVLTATLDRIECADAVISEAMKAQAEVLARAARTTPMVQRSLGCILKDRSFRRIAWAHIRR